jgi:hypothetical protein
MRRVPCSFRWIFFGALAAAGLVGPAQAADLCCRTPPQGNCFRLLDPPPVGVLPFEERVRPALRNLCGWTDKLEDGKVTDDAATVALALLQGCGGPQPTDADIARVNDWLMSLEPPGEVGTNLSTYATAVNGTTETVLAAWALDAFGGIPMAPSLVPLVVPAATLTGSAHLVGVDGLCETEYDVDMGLVGLVRLLYLHGQAPNAHIRASARQHVIHDLLTQVGGADEWRDHPRLCGIALPVPETENHILMTESSRYLTNQLIRKGMAPTDPSYPRYDNQANGLRHKLLEKLSRFLNDDFHEYNARPYALFSLSALHNLRDFAEEREVRRGAKLVLDYLAAKFAVSSSWSRRVVPYRRLTESESVTDLFHEDADEETSWMLQLTGDTRFLAEQCASRMPNTTAMSMAKPGTSIYRVPGLIADLMIHPEHAGDPAYQRFRHEGYELYYRRPTFLLSAGGVHRPGWTPDAWEQVGIDGAVGLVAGHPLLGPLLGETLVRELIESTAEKETASALPITLMPTRGGTDWSHFIRIDGAPRREERNNTCVSPPGFACGIDPVIPPTIPESCKKQVGHWTFVNLNDGPPGCDKFGFLVAFWSDVCAGGDGCGSGQRFGFFEVIQANADITFDLVVSKVLANNAGATFAPRERNVYTTFGGDKIPFTPMTPIDTWPIWNGNQRVDMRASRPIRGDLMNNLWPQDDVGALWRKNCVEIDNPFLQRRLILDFRNPAEPSWCEISTTGFIQKGCKREPCDPQDTD